MSRFVRRVPTALSWTIVAAGLAASASAQPKLILTSLSSDMAGTGNKCIGYAYDNSVQRYVPYVWERGVGYTRINGAYGSDNFLACSNDGSVLGMAAPNTSNWGDLNCFGGYCWNGYSDPNHTIPCTLGSPNPAPVPCGEPSMAHRWTAATGWVNAGSFTRSLDAATGRWFGGTRCDYTINYPNDMSGDGRYIVGGGWYAQLIDDRIVPGGPGSGICGDFAAFRYDAVTGVFERLNSASGSKTTRADHVNNDGSVVTGYDLGPLLDIPSQSDRRACVWTNGVQTILDAYLGAGSSMPINGPGTILAGVPSSGFNQAAFGQSGIKLVRWVRQPNNTWTPQNLGRPADRFDPIVVINMLVALWPSAISDDGNTIVGTAQYGQLGPGGETRPFIWRPTLNGGVPMDLADYIAQISPGSPILEQDFLLTYATGLSADGNTLFVRVYDNRNTCPEGSYSLTTFHAGILYLNGASIACDPPRIGLGPKDTVGTQYTPFGVSLNVVASGSWPMTFQWQREDPNQAGTWFDLTEACANFVGGAEWDYEGVHKNQLRVGQANCGGSPTRAGRYRVVVTNSCGSVTSDPAAVSYLSGVMIIDQPEAATTCSSGSATISVTAGGTGPFTYQWQINDPANPGQWIDIPDGYSPDGFVFANTTANALAIAPAARFNASHNRTFRCAVSNNCGTVPTAAAALNIACPSNADVASLGGTLACDGQLTVDDIVGYLAQFFGGNLAVADIVGLGGSGGPDNQITVDDLVAFLSAFFAGCH